MQNMATTETECVSFRDLYASPGKIEEQLNRTGQLVFTENDNPVAIMLKVDNLTLKDTLLELRGLKAQMIIKAMQDAAVRNGTSNMTLEEINEEINSARAEKRNREING